MRVSWAGWLVAWTLDVIEPAELKAHLATGTASGVLDVRTPSEWEAGHIEGAVHIPIAELNRRLADVPEGPLAVICDSGYRSAIACSLLLRNGRRDVLDVPGVG